MDRVLETEVMDTPEAAIEYDAMDFTEINLAFAQEAIALYPQEQAIVLDAGTGTGRIPILMAQIRPQWQIIAIDLAANMLQIAAQNIQSVGLQQQIHLELIDAKNLPYPDAYFDLVISNSLVHHLPNPLPFFQEIGRVLKPHGAVFLRDLFRPQDEATIDSLVDNIGVDYDQEQRKLFRDSLHAAFTVDEIQELIHQTQLGELRVYQSSDRHWTATKTSKY
ncbi:class I SAM-dependent methyltransferase [Calothrix sp. 336/3]|uniref:class I SAM-dependent methyltransferase n=1 Tax=Calothrix sp. 336/3 TaxID=1337936 RepID=UPI0004E304FE|nr:class I SAM-dependent methyltransferase [Calothrix sp. 336/3]AKG24843.1 methyltransferase [Calothrix sp. 336/3]